MENIDYKNICADLLSGLTERQAVVLRARFGLFGNKQETLQEIGKGFNITRERVRQIERGALAFLRKKENEKARDFFFTIEKFVKSRGGACSEKELLMLAPKGIENEFTFLLCLNKNIKRAKETDSLLAFWFLNDNIKNKIESTAQQMLNKLSAKGKPLEKEALFAQESPKVCFASLSIAKKIDRGPLGDFGLISWSEIKPRGVRDSAFLALKKANKPMHFKEIAEIINGLPQTVHNELIRDPQFILVGRGIYGLSDWGYEKGTVLDIIKKILKKFSKPVEKEKIVDLVLSERLVKPSTILLNLNNKSHFQRDSQGKYAIKEV